MKSIYKDLSFSDALNYLKSGGRVSRDGWNGKGQWLVLIGNREYDIIQHKTYDAEQLAPFIAIRTNHKKMGVYTPTSCDLLADDWFVLLGVK